MQSAPASKRRLRRRAGTVLAAAGVLLVAYAAATVLWRDPVTDLYTRYRQQQLAGELGAGTAVAAAGRADVAAAARRLLATARDGQPLGRLAIPKLGIDPVFVEGTNWAHDLSKGPGHYADTALPGLGKTVGIAAHRTTFGAWFRHIDRLRKGDPITVELPYGTFRYRVFAHEVVASDDWSIIRQRGFDELVLSACHPLYSASHRYVVYARLVSVDPSGGSPYRLT